MPDTCPTVKIKTDAPDNEQGFVLINESDFDPAVHVPFDPPPEDKKKSKFAAN